MIKREEVELHKELVSTNNGMKVMKYKQPILVKTVFEYEKKQKKHILVLSTPKNHGKPMVNSPLIRPAIYWGGSFGGVP